MLITFSVPQGTRGVLTKFGTFVRDQRGRLVTFAPGLHGKAPWTRAHVVSLAERSESLDDKGAAIEALAPDGTRVRVNARVRYRVDPDQIETFIAANKDATAELRSLFRLVVREQIARLSPSENEISAFTALRGRMPELQQRTRDAMEHEAKVHYGILVIAVDFLQIDPPDELVDALNAVVAAESEANSLVARTELQSQQRTLAAEHSVAIAHAHAMATEAEIRIVGTDLATLHERGVLGDYVERRKAEVMGTSKRVYLNHSSQGS